MSTQVVLSKQPSGHNLAITIRNGNDVGTFVLKDNECKMLMLYGGMSMEVHEVNKETGIVDTNSLAALNDNVLAHSMNALSGAPIPPQQPVDNAPL